VDENGLRSWGNKTRIDTRSRVWYEQVVALDTRSIVNRYHIVHLLKRERKAKEKFQ
jgi:(2Fe-2S) ferredoxin